MAEEPELRATMIDGTHALFGLVIMPTQDGRLDLQTFGSGMAPEEAAAVLRRLADHLDTLEPPSGPSD